ncbi:adenosylcobinamide amidohydrolase [Halobacillus sp. KGW1]|uniref:adenosylcobinamide amidohydrolase n=1 Tax=Halobacillus sp. KGW1 TaxID=1793726 RepID=UPI00078260F4|nr:adenosylcobinamide amidohydrolase [Halobacillus sp. KGW1]
MIMMKGVSGGYQSKRIVHDIDLSIETGRFFTLLGPNGSGKTTLFKLITGILPAATGTIQLFGRSLHTFSPREKARMMAVLSQESYVEFDFTVREIVTLGRYPHQRGWLKHTTKEDLRIVDAVMEETDVRRYENQPFRTLSGGEKQRVLLAKALAQQPKILFLDEPTNHLDIKHTVVMLEHLKKHQRDHDLTIVAILHDLNTAALFADDVGLLQQGKLVATGDLSLLQQEDLLQEVYDVPVHHHYHPEIPKSQIVVTPNQETGTIPDYQIIQNAEWIHLQFTRPLRTMANSVIGGGIGWSTDFCNFHVDLSYDCREPETDVISWMKTRGVDPAQTIGMMTAVHLQDYVICKENVQGIGVMAVVTAGVGNAVDISRRRELGAIQPGTINIMVFVDAHLTDGALVNAVQSVTEAKVKALADRSVLDPVTGSTATGTSTDSTVVASTQVGALTPYAGSGTAVGQAIGTIVYRGVRESLDKYEKRGSR